MINLDKEVVIKELFFRGHSVRTPGDTIISVQSLEKSQYNAVKKRFIKEGRTLAGFDHENIVKVNFIFEENNTVYLVLDYIKGETLQEYVERLGKIDATLSIGYINQVCKALNSIHEQQILHRDIKPSNIMITPNGNAILIDFGIAKQFVEDRTVSNTGAHTPGYAPIEQYAGKRLGPATDIYSLSATLYYAITGQRPVEATERLEEELTPPTQLNPKISQKLSDLVMRGMSIKSSDRYQNITDFTNALSQIGLETIDDNATVLESSSINKEKANETILDQSEKDALSPPPKKQRSEFPPFERRGQGNIGSRLIAFVIDTIVIYNLVIVALHILDFRYLAREISIIRKLENASYQLQDFIYQFRDIIYGLLPISEGGLVIFAISIIYFTILEASPIQASIGKKIMNLKVTNSKEQRISFWKSGLRFIIKYPFLFILYLYDFLPVLHLIALIPFAGLLPIIFSKKERGLHDLLANSYVIRN